MEEPDTQFGVTARRGKAGETRYRNFRANPDVVVEIGDRTIDAHSVEVHGTERDRLYAVIADQIPVFKEHEKHSTRVFPVIVLHGVRAP